VCNRCVAVSDDTNAPADPRGLCDCCRFNDTIPDLSVAGNQKRWARLEAAKRRLFYDLKLLMLPYGTKSDGVEPSLAFDFKADVIPDKNYWRCSDEEERVYTGHADGRITINIREADDVEREKLRVVMGETQRTLIGHFRHEIGHYYWDLLIKGQCEEQFKAVFGDHNSPTYAEALEAYYQNGPAADWQTRLISGYASMHPWEDFAETWAVYMDIVSVLDTATNHQLGMVSHPLETDLVTKVTQYQTLGISLNEINRSLGLLDAVPEVFVQPVVEKLHFIHQIARADHTRPPAAATMAQPVKVPPQPVQAAK